MKIFDSHIHIGKWDHEWYAGLNVNVKDIWQYADKAILLPTNRKSNMDVLTQAESYPDRAYFFIWADPYDVKQTIPFFEKHIDNIYGIKFHSSTDRIAGGISNNCYTPYLKIADEHDA